jgi:Txe/YoeB family toxin of Txe-Axe toxin-antitoxin module
METLGDKIQPKFSQNSASKFYCKYCDYGTSKKCNYDTHIASVKHQRITKDYEMGHKSATNQPQICKSMSSKGETFVCYCGKEYHHRQGLWKHKKTCSHNSDENNIISNEPTDKDLIMMLIKDNSEFKNMMMEVLKNGTHNTNTTTNSHNKAFNLQFFLNETCKDAMNIMDFVESIQLQLSDLEKMGEIGYVEGISNIIVKNLNALDVTQRPVHCTDKKRETIYIKDEDKWEKDDDKNKIRKVIKKVATKNARLIQKFKEKHPDYNEYNSKYSTQYHKLIIESFGGSGDNDLEKEDKIIRNITKNILVDKEP